MILYRDNDRHDPRFSPRATREIIEAAEREVATWPEWKRKMFEAQARRNKNLGDRHEID